MKGFPTLYWFGREGDYNIMAMELLGPSLEALFKKCDRHFSTATVISIALQLVAICFAQTTKNDRFLELNHCTKWDTSTAT